MNALTALFMCSAALILAVLGLRGEGPLGGARWAAYAAFGFAVTWLMRQIIGTWIALSETGAGPVLTAVWTSLTVIPEAFGVAAAVGIGRTVAGSKLLAWLPAILIGLGPVFTALSWVLFWGDGSPVGPAWLLLTVASYVEAALPIVLSLLTLAYRLTHAPDVSAISKSPEMS